MEGNSIRVKFLCRNRFFILLSILQSSIHEIKKFFKANFHPLRKRFLFVPGERWLLYQRDSIQF